jgi:hypothetical protein
MTTKADLSAQEWKVVREGPPAAGMIVITAASGGMFRETIAMSKAYTRARSRHGASELLDEIVAARPELDHTRYRTPGELKAAGLEHLRAAATTLSSKATPAEVADYQHFVLDLARDVAAAHREAGADVSPAETEAIGEIAAALGTTAG